jgi:hypothetical protein
MPVIRHVLRRLRCSIGTIVLLASFMMLDSSVVLTGKVTDRVDRTQRARVAMEDITRKLRSQVCPSAGQAALINGDAYTVKFYSFMGTRPFVPDIRQIAWDTNTNSIIETRWAGTGTSPNTTWTGTPITRTLLTDVKPPPANAPMFAYYATGAATPFAVPLSATDLPATAQIKISFVTYAQGRNTTGTSTTVQSEVLSRTADPNGFGGSTAPQCA